METLYGTILENATVQADDGTIHNLPVRGTAKDGSREVLIDATDVGGDSEWHRQSIKPFIGMRVVFQRVEKGLQGFNYTIVK